MEVSVGRATGRGGTVAMGEGAAKRPNVGHTARAAKAGKLVFSNSHRRPGRSRTIRRRAALDAFRLAPVTGKITASKTAFNFYKTGNST